MTEILNLAGSVEIEAAAAGDTPRPRTLHILAYGGGPMKPQGWPLLAVDLAGLSLPPTIPILADHRGQLDSIVGSGTPQVQAGQLYVTGPIASGPVADRVIQLAADGVKLGASIGIEPLERRQLRSGDSLFINGRTLTAGNDGLTIITKSKLRETSLTAIPADDQTQVALAANRGAKMEPTTTTNVTQPATPPTPDPVEVERQRTTAILAACGSRIDLATRAINAGWTPQETRLEMIRSDRASVPLIVASRPTAPDKNILAAATLIHMGRESVAEKAYGSTAAQQARDMGATSMIDLCRAALHAEGISIPSSRHELIRAAVSTISLPNALGDAANKILLQSYTDSPATWRAFCRVETANDFKNHKAIRPSSLGNLAQVAPGGSLSHTTIGETVYEFRVDTFGRLLGVDRRDLINDDLSLFDTNSQAFGRAAARSLADLVYEVLLAGSGVFFVAGNGNYADGSGTVLSATSLAAGIAAMLAQRDDDDFDLDIRPRTLLVPPELQQTARTLLLSDFIQRANNDTPTGNALKNSLALETEPRLSNTSRFTGASAVHWYLFGSPQDAAQIVAFLGGIQQPTVEFFGISSDPNTLAATWRVYFDYGSALADFRAGYRAKGEA